MNCDAARDLGPAHRKGLLEEAVRVELDVHVEACAGCADWYAEFAAVTCEELAGFLSDYLDDELPATQRAVFRVHLEQCPPCGDYMESFRRTKELSCEVGSEPSEPPPGALVRGILDALRRKDS